MELARRGRPAPVAGPPAALSPGWGRRLDVATRWSLRAGALVLPLAVWPFGYDVFVLPKLAALRLLVLALAALRVATWAATGRRRRGRTSLDLPLALLVGSAALSTAFAVNLDVALFGTYYRYEGLLTIVLYALLFRLAARAVDGREAWALARSLLLGGYLVALVAAVQWAIGGAAVGAGAGESARTYAGTLRATSTLGNADLLAAFMAMLLPVAVHEMRRGRGAGERLLAGNVVAVLALALVLTFSRAAWVGAALGVAMVAAAPVIRAARRRPALAAGWALTALALLGWIVAARAAPRWLAPAAARAATLADPAAGSGATRLHIWHDSIALVAARPLTGWGPDTFGLVYPRFATGDWTPGLTIDKAHSDLVQVAATQGLVGLAACACLAAFVAAAFWRGRRRPGAVAMLAALVAYEVPLLVGFTWLPAAAPAWLLLAAAVAVWRPPPASPATPLTPAGAGLRRARVGVGAVAAAALLVAAIGSAALPVAADMEFRAGLAADAAGDRAAALAHLAAARRLAPQEGVYAAEDGAALLDVDPSGTPGPRADPAAARGACRDAVRLGDAQPRVLADLAAADRMLAADPRHGGRSAPRAPTPAADDSA